MSDPANKIIGDANQKARAAAAETLAQLKGRRISKLSYKQTHRLITAIAQWLGLADEKGRIK
jgi:hypothetical protein